MTKVLICDLDGTLLDKNNEISLENMRKIQSFSNSGGTFIIATGRLDHDIVYVEKQLGIQGAFRISQNGAVITNKDGKVVFKQEIDSHTAKGIMKILDKRKERVEVNDAIRRYFPSPRPMGRVAEFVDSSVIDPQLNKKVGNNVIPTIFLIFGEKSGFKEIKAVIHKKYEDIVNCVKTSDSSLEIMSKNISKGVAVRQIMKELNRTTQDVYVIGDSENDISMFEAAGYSFAIDNASDQVKQKADEIQKTVADCIEVIMNTSPKVR
ncbi:HAD family hydrolase [Cerasibacillus sp. JNUCC 74]